ncbi:hypothetical protein Peur_008600 [Populus x canadensis]
MIFQMESSAGYSKYSCLKLHSHTLGDGDVPLLDIVTYGGCTFAAESVVLLASIVSAYFFYAVTLWECFCMGMFFIEILKRMIAEVTSSEKHSSKRHYLLLFVPDSHSSVGLEMLLFRRLFFK